MSEPTKVMGETITVIEPPPKEATNGNDMQDITPASKATRITIENSQDTRIESSLESTLGTIIEAFRKVHKTLSQKMIGSPQRTNAQESVSWAINQIRTLNNGNHEKQTDHSLTHDSSRLTNIEKELAEIKQAIIEQRKTYAQAAQCGQVAVTHAQTQSERAKRERLEQERQERAKTAVTLTFRNASESVQMNLKETSESGYAILQKSINESTTKGFTIRKLQKLPGKLLKIYCHSEDDAKQLREVGCEKALEGVTLASQEYGVVLDGMPVNVLDARTASQSDMRELIQDTNNINVKHVEPLTKKPRNPGAPTQSIIVLEFLVP